MIIIILVFISEELMTELQKPSDAKDDSTQAPSIVCNQETFNDGICDEENNNESCGFDGGDCCEFHDLWDSRCKSQGKVSTKYIYIHILLQQIDINLIVKIFII